MNSRPTAANWRAPADTRTPGCANISWLTFSPAMPPGSTMCADPKALKQKLDALKAEIKPRDLDKADLVGELRRQELRAFLADLPHEAERMRLVLGNPQFAEAALGAPCEVSGFHPNNIAPV